MDYTCAEKPYESARTRADWTTYVLFAGIVTSAASIVSGLIQISRSSGLAADTSLKELEPGLLTDLLQASIGLGTMAVTITTVVFFLIWFHRAYRNLSPLGARNLQYSPRWAVGAWFIPFANLFIPFRIAKEVWQKSDNDTSEFGFLKNDSTVPGFMPAWWGFWIASNVASNLSFRLSMRAGTVSEQQLADTVNVFSEILSIPAAILAIRVIKSITLRQEESSQRIPGIGQPPPPPVFDSGQGASVQ